jgi:hypothetical protein
MRMPMTVAVAVLSAASLAAQTPVDFSGKWAVAPGPSAPATQRGGRTVSGNMGSGWGAEIALTQDADKFTVEYAQFTRADMQPPIRLVYRLNGSESRNTINMGRGPQEQISRAAWEGSTLVITTTHTFKDPQSGQPATSETKHVLSLESPTSLVIETTRGAAMGGQPSTTKTVYRKN